MEFKNLYIVEGKLNVLINKIDKHLDCNTRKMDDMEMMLSMIEYHIDDIEIMKQSIEKGKGKVKESDFQHFIIDINHFANDAIKLL